MPSRFSILAPLTTIHPTILNLCWWSFAGTADIFFRKLMAWPGGHNEAPPVFSISNIHFVHIRRNNLYFVCTTKFNTSPALSIELLTRLSALCKDYCGVLTEESIRLNFVLIYEILDEVREWHFSLPCFFYYIFPCSFLFLKKSARKNIIIVTADGHVSSQSITMAYVPPTPPFPLATNEGD